MVTAVSWMQADSCDWHFSTHGWQLHVQHQWWGHGKGQGQVRSHGSPHMWGTKVTHSWNYFRPHPRLQDILMTLVWLTLSNALLNSVATNEQTMLGFSESLERLLTKLTRALVVDLPFRLQKLPVVKSDVLEYPLESKIFINLFIQILKNKIVHIFMIWRTKGMTWVGFNG